jgi:hypothetical protein
MSFQYSALQAGAAGTRNQRATVRYQCAPATSGRIVVTGDFEFQRAWVLDLSTRGVGLFMSRPVKTGVALVIQLKSASQKTYELSARVVHATEMPTGDFRIGCEFTTGLSDDDLDALL